MRVLIQPDWAGDSTMKRTRHSAEQIIRKLKTREQLIAQGKTVYPTTIWLRGALHQAFVTCFN